MREREFEASKKFAMGGATFCPGSLVDVSSLPDHKVSQLLNQRYIQPRRDSTPREDGQGGQGEAQDAQYRA